MSAEIVNLRQFRKKQARSEKDKEAEQNRISFGRTNTESDIDAFMAAWQRIQAPAATQLQPAA